MSAFDLERVLPPKPVAPKVCMACKAFRAECVVPVGESSAPMCWLCAHHVVDHECPPGKAATAECECMPHQIYPGREPPIRFEHGDITREMIEKATPEELMRGALYNRKTGQIEEVEFKRVNQPPYRRAGATRTGTITAIEATIENKRRACSVCQELGHYAKTCPIIARRGR